MKAVGFVITNWIFITLEIIIFGFIFGTDFLLGLQLGFLLASAEITFNGLIRGTSTENARIYNDLSSENDKVDK